MDAAILEAPGEHAAAGLAVHQQVEHEILDEELGLALQALLIERVQYGMAGAVRGGGRAMRGLLAVVERMATEGPLIDLARLGAREGHAHMLELDHRRNCLAAHVFDGVLVAQPIGALDRVVHVPAPIVLAHIAERGADAALRRDGMAARRKHLGDAGSLESGGAHAEARAQSGAAGADDDDVIDVIGDGICRRHRHQPPNANLARAAIPSSASSQDARLLARSAACSQRAL